MFEMHLGKYQVHTKLKKMTPNPRVNVALEVHSYFKSALYSRCEDCATVSYGLMRTLNKSLLHAITCIP